MLRNAFALASAGGVVIILFCSDVEAFRSESVTDDIIQTQCSGTDAQSSDVELGHRLDRPQAVASGTSVSRRVAVTPVVEASLPAYPTLTVPQLYQPSARLGLPVLHYPAGPPPPPRRGGAPQLMRPALQRTFQHPGAPSFGSLRLADARGQLLEPPRYIVVALDNQGRPAGIPLFQEERNGSTYSHPCSGFLGAAAPPEVYKGGVGPPIGESLDVASQDSLAWKTANAIDTGATYGTMGFSAHAAYQVEEAARTGHNVAHTVNSVDAGAIGAIGHWAKAQNLLPATKDHTAIFAGVAHGGAHITAGVGVGFSGLGVVVSASQMYASYQAVERAEERAEEIWEVSHEMTDQEYDAALAQLDAVVEHHGRTFALSAAGAVSGGIAGTVGVMVLAGTSPVWAPPVGLSAVLAGSAIGFVNLGRMWLDPEPQMPDAASLLEVAHNTDVNPSSYLSDGGIDSTTLRLLAGLDDSILGSANATLWSPKIGSLSDAEENPGKLTKRVKIDYVKSIVEPTWSRIFARKHNLVPFYIDMLWRELQKKFGMQMKYILIQDPHNVIHSPKSSAGEKSFRWDEKIFSREYLINLLQELDHPSKKLWWVSDTDDADFFEDGPAHDTRFWGQALDVGTHPSSATLPTAAESDASDSCFLKGPSPDAYCQAQFGPEYICDFSIDGSGVLLSPSFPMCKPSQRSEESSASRVDAFGVTATMGTGDETRDILTMRITDPTEFKRYWTSLHGFNDKDWEPFQGD